jgi:hypothetical protein
MRRRSLITAVLVACLTAAGATFAAAKGPAKHHSSGNHHTQRTLTIYTVTPKDGLAVLAGQAGTFSLGDRVAFSDDLFTSKGGTALGTDGGACTVARVTDAATGFRDPPLCGHLLTARWRHRDTSAEHPHERRLQRNPGRLHHRRHRQVPTRERRVVDQF